MQSSRGISVDRTSGFKASLLPLGSSSNMGFGRWAVSNMCWRMRRQTSIRDDGMRGDSNSERERRLRESSFPGTRDRDPKGSIPVSWEASRPVGSIPVPRKTSRTLLPEFPSPSRVPGPVASVTSPSLRVSSASIYLKLDSQFSIIFNVSFI